MIWKEQMKDEETNDTPIKMLCSVFDKLSLQQHHCVECGKEDQACQRLHQDHKYLRMEGDSRGNCMVMLVCHLRRQRIERYCIHFLPGLLVGESFCDDVHDKDQEMLFQNE